MKKKVLLFAMVGILSMGIFTGCGSLKDEDVVVTVGDKKVTADIANFYARYTQAQYETYYSAYLGENMWNTEASKGKTYEESVKDSVLEQLEQMYVLEDHMKEYKVALTDQDKALVEEYAKKFDEDNALDSKEEISGSKKTVKRVLTLLAIQTKMTDAIQADVDTEVSDEEAAQKSMQYVLFPYTAADEAGNSTTLSDDKQAAAKEQATAFAAAAKEAQDFAALATEQSMEAQTATFDSKSTTPDADLITAADALQEGETTDVIETDAGCYVAKVTSLLDRAATDTKKGSIVEERKTKLSDDACKKWLDKAGVKVDKKVWKKIDFNDLTVTMKQSEEDPYADKAVTDDQAE